MNDAPKTLLGNNRKSERESDNEDHIVQIIIIPPFMDKDVMGWSVNDVQSWLRYFELESAMGMNNQYCIYNCKYPSLNDFICLLGPMESHKVDGILLLRLTEEFVHDTLNMKHTLRRKRLMRLLDRLKQHQQEHKKVSSFHTNQIFLFI
jgi:hypothetical protein